MLVQIQLVPLMVILKGVISVWECEWWADAGAGPQGVRHVAPIVVSIPNYTTPYDASNIESYNTTVHQM